MKKLVSVFTVCLVYYTDILSVSRQLYTILKFIKLKERKYYSIINVYKERIKHVE